MQGTRQRFNALTKDITADTGCEPSSPPAGDSHKNTKNTSSHKIQVCFCVCGNECVHAGVHVYVGWGEGLVCLCPVFSKGALHVIQSSLLGGTIFIHGSSHLQQVQQDFGGLTLILTQNFKIT